VSYLPSRLKVLGKNAKAGLLSPEDKIGLLSDALAMAGSGHLNAKTSDVLQLLQEFTEETNYYVWKQILAVLTTIKDAWMFEDQSALNAFQVRLVTKRLDDKGWTFKDSDYDLERMLKPLIFAHSTKTEKVEKAAKEMFEAFLGGDEKAIDVNILDAVLFTVLEQGGAKEVRTFGF